LLYQGFENDEQLNLQKVFENITQIKNHVNRPLFITLTHHFYNKICGHTRSFHTNTRIEKTIQNLLVDQNFGMNTGFTAEGIEIVNYLLEINNFSNTDKRILIDVKHMSILSRRIYRF
jgi:hypothetical protein